MSRNNQTRQTLIARIRDQHDEDSWGDFVHHYEKYIYTVVSRVGLNHHDALDLVQTVLLRLWKNLQGFDYQPYKCKFRTWMNTVIRNEVALHYRTKGRYNNKIERAGELSTDKSVQEPQIYEIAEEEWKQHISSLAILKVKESTNEKVMECFQLFSADHSVEEICEKLDLTRSTAYRYRKEVLTKVHREIRDLNEELS